MAGLVRRAGPCRLDELQRRASFEALTRAIVYQQLSGQAAATIYRRFVRALGARRPSPARVLAASPERLREAGLSVRKAEYVRDLAAHVDDGRLSLRRLRHLDDEEVIERLCEVRGIGRWTAQMFLIFHLGRLDVLPVGDLAVRESARIHYGRPPSFAVGELEALGEAWRPYRSVASWYLWQTRRADGAVPELP